MQCCLEVKDALLSATEHMVHLLVGDCVYQSGFVRSWRTVNSRLKFLQGQHTGSLFVCLKENLHVLTVFNLLDLRQ